jgi:Protein of unknown function (DUF3313)
MSKDRGGIVGPAMALAIVAALGACAETKQVTLEQPPPASAVLPDPALLQKGTTGEVDRIYLNPSAHWASYTKVILDPVTIWTGRDSDMAKASPAEQKALADAFYTELHTAVAKRCEVVTEPSPGTMRWHIALVDATSVNPFLNTLSTYEPHIHLVDVAAGYVFDHGVAYWVGEATAEGYARDAMTGVLIWEGADERAGTKAWGRDTFNSWDDVDNAFKAWSEQFATRLTELGACPA